MITNAQLHHVILIKIIEKGFAPTNQWLAEYFSTSVKAVEEALIQLQEYHGVVLHPNEPKVWVIHPFSLAPTNFFIESESGQWWGNCAWCSLGAAALLNRDLTISTTIGAESKQVKIEIVNGQIQDKSFFIHFPIPMKNAWDNVIYTCSNMLLFENEEQVKTWSMRHDIRLGDIQPIDNIWQFAKEWYGNHLNPDWEKWTIQEAKEIFSKHHLQHPVWNLEASKERF